MRAVAGTCLDSQMPCDSYYSLVSLPRTACLRIRQKGGIVRQSIVAGNWKMHGNRAAIATLVDKIVRNLPQDSAKAVVFPPFVYLDAVRELVRGSTLGFGAQNINANESGAYTGEISALQLRDVGCQYALVGHSERRRLFFEDDVSVAMKFAACRRHDITPILCVGETLTQREQGLTETVVFQQLNAVLSLEEGIHGLAKAVIAYEPVWAIGTGKTASPEQAQAVHAYIRSRLAEFDKEIAQQVTIVYGGSVKASNARELFSMPDIDGGLVGAASLDAAEFIEIVQCTKSYS